MTDRDRPLLHICYAPTDRGWVHGRMVRELGLQHRQYRTREDDGLGELQLQAIADAVEECRFTVLIASSAARWDKLAQFAAGLAQQAGLEGDVPRLIIVARDFAPSSEAERARLSLGQRALVGLDCSDDEHTIEALARLRTLLALDEPRDERPACPYPGLARFTEANRDLLFGRDEDKDAVLQRIRLRHTRILVVGPSGSGKSSLIHAAVLPKLPADDHVVRVVPRGGDLATALRTTLDTLEVPALGSALDRYRDAILGATDTQVEEARAELRAVTVADARRRVIVIDPLEEIFADDDQAAREALFALLGGLWSLPWCTVILCMRADFYGALMAERSWRELEPHQYPVAPLDELGLRAAIVEPARRAGVHVDAALVERLIREIDRDRSSVPLPLLQVALQELWARLRWRYLTLTDYGRIVSRDQQRGLAAVLAVHAEAVLQALTGPGDRAVAQRILIDLVHLGEGRPHTRRRRRLHDLRRSGDAPEQLERVVEMLVEGRLVTTSDGEEVAERGADGSPMQGRHVDLAHDTLITGWSVLAGWIAEHRDQLHTQRRLEARAASGGLLTSDELPEFLRWVARSATPAGQLLGASEPLRALVRRSVAARWFRGAGLGLGLVATTAVAIVFGLQAQRLRQEQAKTGQSLHTAMKTADAIAFDFNENLSTVACAGASVTREHLLKRLRELAAELSKLGKLNEVDQRTAMAGKAAEARLALERGHLEQASDLYGEVLKDAERRAAAEPSNDNWQGDLSLSYEKLGEVALSAGKLGDARGWFEKDLAVAKALATTDPSNAAWQRLSVSYEKLGEVAANAGKLDDARGWFEKDLAVVQTLAAADPSNAKWRGDLSLSYLELGDVAVFAGKLDDARGWFEKSLTVAQALAAADPSNAGSQRGLSVSYEGLGDVAVSAGKLDDARGWFDKSLAVRKTLAAADPSTAEWQRSLSISYEKLGDVAVSAGKLDDARSWFDESLAVAKALAAADPSNAGWQRGLSVTYERLGDVAVSAGKLDDARGWFDKSLAVRKALAAADPSTAEWQSDVSGSYNKLGEVAVRAGKVDDARGWFDKALAVRKVLAAADPSNAGWQRDLCISLVKVAQWALDPNVATRDLDEARAIYARLQRGGLFHGHAEFAQIGTVLDQLGARVGPPQRR